MVICNIIVEKSTDKLKSLPDFVNVCDKHWKIVNKIPTLIYGYKTAKELYPNDLKIGERYLRQNIQWSYTEEEMQSECWLDDFVKESVAKHLQCSHHSHDVIFDHRDFDLPSFYRHLTDFPMIHAGAHEIYVATKHYDDSIIVHSFQMDNLKYAGIEPEAFFFQLINDLDCECVLYTMDEIDMTKFSKPPISFQDLLMASNRTHITFRDIILKFAPYVDEFKKEMILAHFIRHELYSPTLFKSFI